MDALIFFNLLLLAWLIFLFYHMVVRSILKRNKKLECTNCTRCCKLLVRLSDKDIKRIKTDLDYKVKRFGKDFIKKVNGYCIFLNIKEGRSSCSIYSMRPDICRNYPRTRIFGIRANDARCKGLVDH